MSIWAWVGIGVGVWVCTCAILWGILLSSGSRTSEEQVREDREQIAYLQRQQQRQKQGRPGRDA